jgi:hypothetical protein
MSLSKLRKLRADHPQATPLRPQAGFDLEQALL